MSKSKMKTKVFLSVVFVYYLVVESKIGHCESSGSNLAKHCLLVDLVIVVEIAC